MFETEGRIQSQSIIWAYRAWRELLRLRSMPSLSTKSYQASLDLAGRALELADEAARAEFPYERDYVRVHWLLGAAYCASGQVDEAEHHLHEALERCRRINSVDAEADILIDLARQRVALGAMNDAERFANEALLITERSGYVMQGADAHLELAKFALIRNDKATALHHATEARRLATCDGPPDYTYKAAYDEADALLKQLT